MRADLEERKKALDAYLTHRREVEAAINDSKDVLVSLAFFTRNRVTSLIEVWRDLVKIRSELDQKV